MAQLFAVVALAGCGTAIFQITDNTYLPALVRRDQLVAANARLETTEATAEIVGPGVAGVLMELITAPLTILLDALTYLVSAIFLARIEVDETLDVPEREPRLRDDLADGARAVWRQPTIRWLFLAETTLAFWNGFFFALYYLFTLRVLGLGEAAVGLIISVGGAGALLGSTGAARISRLRLAGPVLILLLLLNRTGDLLIPMAGLDVGPVMVYGFLIAHQLIADGFRVAYVVLAVSLRQALLPTEVLGRANAWFQLSENAMILVGTLTAGVIATEIGVNAAVWVGVLGGLSGPLLLLPLLRQGQKLGVS
jgi:predicted MFS family arabinose efflux permease